jgi:S-DNA-T family DNA segregation ATPase FtsK/SpoIIIE
MERVVEYWQEAQGEDEPEPDLANDEPKDESPWDKMIVRSNYISERDEMLEEVIELAKKRNSISTSFIQRKLRIGYPRAARLMEALHELGLVDDPKEGGKTRRILLSGEEDPIGDLLDS